jgi:hypothetical protein
LLDGNHSSRQGENEDRRPKISIVELRQSYPFRVEPPNNGPERRLNLNEQVTFEIMITDSASFQNGDIINIALRNNSAGLRSRVWDWVDPVERSILSHDRLLNANYFDVRLYGSVNERLWLTITRLRGATHHRPDGKVQLILWFGDSHLPRPSSSNAPRIPQVIINNDENVGNPGFTWVRSGTVTSDTNIDTLEISHYGSVEERERGNLFVVNLSAVLPPAQENTP